VNWKREPARPRAIRQHPKAAWFAVATVCLGAFMGQLDASIVTMIFPALQRTFQAPLAQVQWVSLAYLLTLVGLVAPLGRLADAVGRKLVYLYGFALFALASAACGFAPDLPTLVLFRVVQALGAAMLQSNSVAIVVTSVAPGQVRAALGVQASAQALGLALGPVVGGALVATVGWQWVFWVNVPIGLLALVAGRYLLPRTRDHSPLTAVDWIGVALLAAATTAMLLALSAVSGLQFAGWVAASLLAASAACTIGFVLREARAVEPLFDLALLRPARVSAGLAGALCAYLVLFGPLTLFPQILGAEGGPDAMVGAILSALPVGFAVAALLAERVLPRAWDARRRALSSASLCALAAAALALAPMAPAWVAAWLALLGLGLGVFIPANNASIMAAIPARSAASGGGLVNMGRGLGTALGVSLVTLCLHRGGLVHGPIAALAGLALFSLAAAASGLPSRSPLASGQR